MDLKTVLIDTFRTNAVKVEPGVLSSIITSKSLSMEIKASGGESLQVASAPLPKMQGTQRTLSWGRGHHPLACRWAQTPRTPVLSPPMPRKGCSG